MAGSAQMWEKLVPPFKHRDGQSMRPTRVPAVADLISLFLIWGKRGPEAVPDSASSRHIAAPGHGEIIPTPRGGGACWQDWAPEATSSAGPPALAQVHRALEGGEGGSPGNGGLRKPKLSPVPL